MLQAVKHIIPYQIKDDLRYGMRVFDGIKGRWEKGYTFHINQDCIDGECSFFSIPNRHCFLGYYDFEQIRNKKMVALSVKKNANPKYDRADIVCFNIDDPKQYKIVGDTGAWCWQQGSRIKWLSSNTDCIVCNDVINESYISKIINVKKMTCEQIINEPLYDIASDDTFGISLNFERSERLRPGYGYSVLEDKTKGDRFPKNDGLWYVDMHSGKKMLLVSLYDLSKSDQNRERYEHYINHISISPDNQNIFFLYIKKELNSERRSPVGYIYNIPTRKFYSLNITGMSHYDWLDNRRIVYSSGLGGGKVGYFIIDIVTLEIIQIGNEILVEDGHPTCFLDGIISDTYPHRNQYQELFFYSKQSNKRFLIGEFFHKPIFYHDERCDLHPRLSYTKEGIYLTCDTTCNKGVRSVFACRLKYSSFV